MKIRIIFILLILFSNNCLAQNKVDSLKTIWSNESLEDTIRLKAVNTLIYDYYFDTKTDSALVLGKKMLEFARQKKHLEFEIEAHTLIGEIYFEKDENEKAFENYNIGLELAKTIEDSIIYAKKLFVLGTLYHDKEDYPNAFKVLQRSKEVCRLVGDSLNEGWSVAYQGFIFRNLGDLKKAEKHHLEHLRLSKKYGIKRSISGANGNLGGVYKDMGDIPKSIKHWKEGIKLAKEIGLDIYASTGTSALIGIYIEEKQYSEAIKYLDEYKMVTKDLESPYYQIVVQSYQCKIDQGLGNFQKALRECELSLKILNEYENRFIRKRVYESLYQINKEIGRHEKALEYYEKYQILNDNEMEVAAREEIHNIEFNNQLIADSIAKAKEKKILEVTYENEVRKKNNTKNIFLLIGLSVLILALGLYSRLRYVNKTKKLLRIEKDRAIKSEQFKQDFLANMSHEIRTPMNAVMGMTNLTLDLPLGEKQRYYLENIKKSGENLLYIINDILDLSKIESGKMALDRIDFSINEKIDYVKQTFQHKAKEKGIELYSTIGSDVPDIVKGDPMRLNQILINLVGNAIKFTLKGSVAIEVNKVTEGIQFKIIDTGIGIPEDKLQSVFESFSQANTSDTRKYGGTGLGLSISQHLIELMNGTISLESKEGLGTTFTFIIDLEEGSPEKLEERIASEQNIDGSILDGLKILITDDNEYNQIVASDTLKSKANVEIVEAFNGQEAIDLVQKKKFDVILMDVQMPVMNGFDATRYIRENFESPIKDIPIIALTASVLRTDLDKCIEAGMNSYIPKPFSSQQLIKGIADVLNISVKTKKTRPKVVKTEAQGVTDLAYLRDFCEGDETRMKKYIDMFLNSSPQLIKSINMALAENDFETIANQVHGFKTKWIMMGMTETKDLAINIEGSCRNIPNSELVVEQIELLKKNIEMANIELKKFNK